MSLAENIKKIMTDKGISQSKLARELKITRQTVNNWVKNRNLPTLEDQKLICKILEVDMNTLTGVPRKLSQNTSSIPDEKDAIIARQAEEIENLRKVLKGLL